MKANLKKTRDLLGRFPRANGDEGSKGEMKKASGDDGSTRA